ncbi:hypothetical protein FOMPIDRAFT_116321 [Fomitopsis schrenkii]|uniref:Uncharacterized protein n=1 Tax=Fomitopsis schrenkii TaxID=2126942 RepID=S8EDP5_FOMSC|nr:hypothetical protein FOMPIDRAFT_116321 [Fomitopsis schrenkii]
MRLTTTFSLLLASLAVAPSVLSYPVANDFSTELEARGVDYDSSLFARGVEYSDELYERSSESEDVTLLARAVAEAIIARADPPDYSRHDPNNGKKPKYTVKDPAPIPKYRQKDPHKVHPEQQPKKKEGGSGRRSLIWDDDALEARADPPDYSRHDPNNGKKPKYTAKDPAPIPKYRQKDPHKVHPEQQPKKKEGGSGRRSVMWDDELEVRADPPDYSRHDPNNGKKPKYTVKDPAPIPKYRQKDPYKVHPEQQPKKKEGRRSDEWFAVW